MIITRYAKKAWIIILLGFITFGTKADEGMWLPMLLDKKNNEMVRKGLKMTPDMIYSVNHNSLKDAIIQFGGGCTGEIVSNEGLLLTNHHCGYASIAGASSVENNYLKNGFWAKSKNEEIPIPGLTAKFLISMHDVTSEVTKALPTIGRKHSKEDYDEAYSEITKKIIERYTKNTNYTADVRPLYSGNQYFVWVYEIFSDVRFVGAPPESLGKFGGDTDNWMWPRHTADFSIFRVYADKNNEPAKYSAENKPYQPRHYLPISIKGQSEGDFTMIMGFPGRTDRYATSNSIKTSLDYINPSIVKLRGMRLEIMKKEMQQDPAVKLQLASKYAQISNYWKYFIGQTEQLKRFDVYDKKKEEEKEFQDWVGKKKAYQNLFSSDKLEEKNYRKVIKPYYYYNEGLFTPSAVLAAYSTVKLRERFLEKDEPDTTKFAESLAISYRSIMGSYNPVIDPQIFSAVNYQFHEDIDSKYYPDALVSMMADMTDHSKADFDTAALYFYTHTMYTDTAAIYSKINSKEFEALFEDPMYLYAAGLKDVYEQKVKAPVLASREEQNEIAKLYLKGLLEMNEDKPMYPDANSTMRFSYGSVEPYSPKDAVFYEYFTTIDGLIEKYKPGDYEFDMPVEVVELYKDKDYGRYADVDGNLHLCFLSTNDITGGNSGSPIMNGKGELLGLAFDGNWEAMSGDIYFDKQYKRTINVDIRYVLWLIEKLGEAPNIISEMKIIEE